MAHLSHLFSLHALVGRQKTLPPPLISPYLVWSSTLVGQADPAGATTAGQHLAAVGRGHPLAEAVDLAALTLLGLIGTEHAEHLLYSYLAGWPPPTTTPGPGPDAVVKWMRLYRKAQIALY